MSELSILQVSPNSTALSAENYQSFEMAKANDGILGGDDIAQIRSYAAYARAQAQAIHKTIAATSGIDDVAAIKAEATETAQTFAKVGIYADQRIGELLRELPTRQGKRTDTTSVRMETEVTKSEAIKNAGIAHQQAIDLQKMAANPEVVEAVIAKAEKDGRVVSRSQVLKAIKERDEARQEVQDVYLASENMEREVESLREQLAKRPKPEVIEREVEVVREVVPERTKNLIRKLEEESKTYVRDYEALRHRYEATRSELERAEERLTKASDVSDHKQTLSQALAELAVFSSKYSGLSELAEVFKAIEKLVA